jgi:hypothetical protein
LAELLAEGVAELDLVAPGATLDLLARLALLLERWGSRINLTGHRTAEGIVRRLILDAVALSFARLRGFSWSSLARAASTFSAPPSESWASLASRRDEAESRRTSPCPPRS